MRVPVVLSLALLAGSIAGLVWLQPAAAAWPGVPLGVGLGLGLAGLLRRRARPVAAPAPAPRAAPPPDSPAAAPPRAAAQRLQDEVEVIHADELLAAEAEVRAETLAAELSEARQGLQETGERLLALEGLRQRAVQDYELQLQHARRELDRARDALGAEMARRVRTEDELRQTADSDPLTGLISPRIFMDRANMAVAQAQRQGGRLGVMAFDVDGFAEINDSLGRAVGDDLLRSLATLLVQSLRQVDTVARLAGNEFSLLLPGLKEPEDALRVAEKLRLALCNPLGLGGKDLLVTASLGIALYPEDGPDTDALLASAQAAARQVRAAGGDGCLLHAPQSAARAAERARLGSELRRALVKGELLLHYQPIQDCASGRPCAVEAFLRWRRPAGLIDAGEFVALADSTGLTLPLGQWALQAAARAVQGWRGLGLELGVTVNVSARQIEHPALPRLVARALEGSGLPAGGPDAGGGRARPAASRPAGPGRAPAGPARHRRAAVARQLRPGRRLAAAPAAPAADRPQDRSHRGGRARLGPRARAAGARRRGPGRHARAARGGRRCRHRGRPPDAARVGLPPDPGPGGGHAVGPGRVPRPAGGAAGERAGCRRVRGQARPGRKPRPRQPRQSGRARAPARAGGAQQLALAAADGAAGAAPAGPGPEPSVLPAGD